MLRTPMRLDSQAFQRIKTVDISTQVLAEFLAMVKNNKAKANAKAKAAICRCLQCDKESHSGCRGLCEYHFSQFKADKEKVGAAIETLTKAEQRRNVTLDEKKQEAKDNWDAEQVRAGRIFESRRGRRPKTPSPFSRTA